MGLNASFCYKVPTLLCSLAEKIDSKAGREVIEIHNIYPCPTLYSTLLYTGEAAGS